MLRARGSDLDHEDARAIANWCDELCKRFKASAAAPTQTADTPTVEHVAAPVTAPDGYPELPEFLRRTPPAKEGACDA